MEKIKLEDNFVKLRAIIITDWKSKKITTQEFCVLIYLMERANIKTGITNINYTVISLEAGDLFKTNKDSINQANKVMLSLKKKQRIWFKEHSGSRGNVDVEIQFFPLKNQEYIDISHHFQQNSSSGDNESLSQNLENPAELLADEQRLKVIENGKDKLTNQMSMSSDSRAPQTDKTDYRETDGSQTNNQISDSSIQTLSTLCGVDKEIANQALVIAREKKQSGGLEKTEFDYAKGIVTNWEKEGKITN